MSKILKTCEICKREIKPKDNYCRLTDYHLGKFYIEKFYHTLCFNNQIRGINPEQKKLKALALHTLAKANKMMAKIGGDEPEKVFRLE